MNAKTVVLALLAVVSAAAALPAVAQTGAPGQETVPPWRRQAAPAPTQAAAPQPAAREDAPRAPSEPKTEWYRPGRNDELLPWNASRVGVFDPWANPRRAALFQRHSFDVEFDGLEFEDGTTTQPFTWAGALTGLRVELGNLGLEIASGSGKFEDVTGASPDIDITQIGMTYTFGAWAAIDLGEPDIRLGLVWPELYGRMAFGSIRDLDVFNLHAGLSLIGLRATLLDFAFAELRLGALSFDGTVWTAPGEFGDETANGTGVNFGLAPNFRIGVAF